MQRYRLWSAGIILVLAFFAVLLYLDDRDNQDAGCGREPVQDHDCSFYPFVATLLALGAMTGLLFIPGLDRFAMGSLVTAALLMFFLFMGWVGAPLRHLEEFRTGMLLSTLLPAAVLFFWWFQKPKAP